MLYSKQEYVLSTEPIDELIISHAQAFLTDHESITHTFVTDEIVVFFTNKKAIFVCTSQKGVYETELLPFTSISRCTVLTSQNAQHGKLELSVSDKITITFCLPSYDDAVKLCRTITY